MLAGFPSDFPGANTEKDSEDFLDHAGLFLRSDLDDDDINLWLRHRKRVLVNEEFWNHNENIEMKSFQCVKFSEDPPIEFTMLSEIDYDRSSAFSPIQINLNKI